MALIHHQTQVPCLSSISHDDLNQFSYCPRSFSFLPSLSQSHPLSHIVLSVLSFLFLLVGLVFWPLICYLLCALLFYLLAEIHNLCPFLLTMPLFLINLICSLLSLSMSFSLSDQASQTKCCPFGKQQSCENSGPYPSGKRLGRRRIRRRNNKMQSWEQLCRMNLSTS